MSDTPPLHPRAINVLVTGVDELEMAVALFQLAHQLVAQAERAGGPRSRVDLNGTTANARASWFGELRPSGETSPFARAG